MSTRFHHTILSVILAAGMLAQSQSPGQDIFGYWEHETLPWCIKLEPNGTNDFYASETSFKTLSFHLDNDDDSMANPQHLARRRGCGDRGRKHRRNKRGPASMGETYGGIPFAVTLVDNETLSFNRMKDQFIFKKKKCSTRDLNRPRTVNPGRIKKLVRGAPDLAGDWWNGGGQNTCARYIPVRRRRKAKIVAGQYRSWISGSMGSMMGEIAFGIVGQDSVTGIWEAIGSFWMMGRKVEFSVLLYNDSYLEYVPTGHQPIPSWRLSAVDSNEKCDFSRLVSSSSRAGSASRIVSTIRTVQSVTGGGSSMLIFIGIAVIVASCVCGGICCMGWYLCCCAPRHQSFNLTPDLASVTVESGSDDEGEESVSESL